MDNWVVKRARLTPRKVAVTDGEASYTFRKVLERALALGAVLERAGALDAQHVAMMATNTIRGYLMAVTLLLHGKTVVWLNWRLTDGELLGQMRDAGVRFCLGDDDLLRGRFGCEGNAPSGYGSPQVLTFGEIFDKVRFGDETTEDVAVKGDLSIDTQVTLKTVDELIAGRPVPQEFADDQVVSVMFTSGSTGHPKGIKQTVHNHFTSATSVALSNGVSPDDEWLCVVPIFHISGYSIILRGLLFGATVRLMGHFDASAVEHALADEPVTWVSVVPTMLKQLVVLRAGAESQPYNPAFKGFILGGEKSDVAMLKRCAELDMPVVRSYGMTETCSQIVGTGLADSRDTTRLLSAGKPYFTTQLRLADGSGEIEIKTGALTSGYIQDDMDGAGEAADDRPDTDVSRETNSGAEGAARDAGNRSHINHFAAKLTADGWYRTGDVGHFDTEGYLYIDGRLDNMLISGGEHVFPEEVERVYADCPGIAEIAVTAEPDDRWGEVPVAYVVPAEAADGIAVRGVAGGQIDAGANAEVNSGDGDHVAGFDASTLESLRTFGRARLAHYKVPHRFYAVDALPKTSTGKVRRFLLGK